MIKTLILMLSIIILMFSCSYNCYAEANLTGVWKDDCGGTYYIRQVGDEVWWYGEERYEDPGWSNVAHGYLKGNVLEVDWADVPKGDWNGKGTLKIKVESNDNLVRIEMNGSNFGSSRWARCRL